MKLSEYPRPPQDTRIGIHWSAGNAGAVGMGEIRSRWIPLLKEMGVKWVKLLHDGGLELAQELLATGIMPIVRLYRPAPNSVEVEEGTLGPREVEALEAYVAIGVRYFEFNNEPELASEWRGPKPDDATAQRIVARNAIRDMETILNKGGLPAIPATAIGTRWDLLGAILEQGGQDLIAAGAWWAVHNYDINHPLDYPYDPVNQDGRLLTQEEYDALGTASWQGRVWGFRSLDFVNQQRQQGARPGITVHDDPSGWLAYTRFADLSLQHLGYYIPILSTENGPIVNEDDDPRYPTTTPEQHRDKVLEMCRIMMGTSTRFEQAPDYYFCTAFWLLGNSVLRAAGPWEEHAWISPRWPGGQLPVVDALRALPKKVWQALGEGEERPQPEGSRIFGQVRGGAGQRLILRGVGYSAETVVGPDEWYAFESVPAGTYRLAVVGTDLVRMGIEVDGTTALQVDFDLREGEEGEEAAPPVWRYTVRDDGPSPGFGVVRCQVQGRPNLNVRIWTEGWTGTVRRTGTKPEYGSDVCEFAPLGGGRYYLQPEEIDVQATVEVDPRRIIWVTFSPAREEVPPSNSVVTGQVVNGAGRTLTLEGPVTRVTTVAEDERFRFENLPAGTYTLRVEGTDVVQEGITLDGTNTVTLVLEVPVETPAPPRESTIRGRVEGGAGMRLRLEGPEQSWDGLVGEDEIFLFTGLPPGTYTLRVVGTEIVQKGIHLDGTNTVEVTLRVEAPEAPEVTPGWTYTLEDGGPTPGFGIVRCEVEGMTNLPVRIWTEGWSGITRLTGSKPEYGPFACEFAPLGSGTYMVTPEGLGVQAQVRVDGWRVVWVRFRYAGARRESVPTEVPKVYDLYLLARQSPRQRADFLSILRYVARFAPEIGQDLEEARKARRVLILGSVQAVSEEEEEALRAAGCQVSRVEGAWAEALNQLLVEGRPV